MSLFSKGISMQANSSCAKNNPKTPKHRRQKNTQAQDLVIQQEKNRSLLLFWRVYSANLPLPCATLEQPQLEHIGD